MKRVFLLGAATLILSALEAAAAAPPVDLEAEYQGVIAAERAFSQLSVDTNAKNAFLANITDESIIFAPLPVLGKPLYQRIPVPPYRLEWWPQHADVARSGDLGWTTGPYELSFPGTSTRFYGYFATVWRKQADGTWRFVADIGTSLPAAPPLDVEPGPLDPRKLHASSTPTEGEDSLASLFAADTELGERTGEDLLPAYASVLAEDGRLLRPGQEAFVGHAAVAALLQAEPGTSTSAPIGGGVSAAGDLGYTYGLYENHGEATGTGAYLRVWERGPGSRWKLALEVLSPR